LSRGRFGFSPQAQEQAAVEIIRQGCEEGLSYRRIDAAIREQLPELGEAEIRACGGRATVAMAQRQSTAR
jgi:hypothetical protein